MATLTKTRMDIADRHTSLYFLGPKAAASDQLGLSGAKYAQLYEKVARAGSSDYSDIAGKAGITLARLLPVTAEDPDRPLKYWIWYMGRGPTTDEVWKQAIPLLSTVNHRVEILPPPAFPAKIAPSPRVMLYPFGWSTWISLLITGNHTLDDLASLISHLFQEKALKVSTVPEAQGLSQYLDLVAKGVRSDAFGGSATKDQKEVNVALVTTVLEKSGASPALGAVGEKGEQQLRSLVRQSGPEFGDAFKKMVVHLKATEDPGYDLNYLVANQMARFIWMEELLKPKDKNQMKLECYHHNCLRSLVQAWQFYGLIKYSSEDGLLQRWSKSKSKAVPADEGESEDDPLASVMTTAFRRLENFEYRNASLRSFLEIDSVKKLIEASRKEAASFGLLHASSGNSQSDKGKQ